MKLDPKTTAVLSLDLQAGILGLSPGYESVLPSAARVAQFARRHEALLVHVGLGFSEGHPEIPVSQPLFSRIRENDLFVRGSPSAEFHPSVFQPGDLVVSKQRISAFSDNALEMILRSRSIGTLVLFGVATSGIVLSTLTRAFDLDYRLIVIEDACADLDPEVHRVLMEKIFPKRGRVLTSDAFLAEQG